MRTLRLLLIVSLFSCNEAFPKADVKKIKQIKVAIIDTGISLKVSNKIPLCKEGHKDFTKSSLDDHHGHGTNISGLIDQYAKNAIFSASTLPNIDKININYCQVILKFYDTERSVFRTEDKMVEAIDWAIKLKVDIINISGGGQCPIDSERNLIKKALDMGIIVVVAAGNNHQELGKNGKYFPAMYDKRVIVVGNLQQPNIRAPSSNFGPIVNAWEIGVNSISYSVIDGQLSMMSGTSQATAIKTGKIIRSMIYPR
jgi:subtilisin family serine protease